MKPTGKFAKEQDALMHSLGYALTWKKGARGGHPVYVREGFESLELSLSPHNARAARARLLRELRRRHPDHPMWRSMKKPRRHRRGKFSLAPATPRALKAVESNPEPRPVKTRLVAGALPACVGCGRDWLSDLDYSTRPCPNCGGVIRVRQEAA